MPRRSKPRARSLAARASSAGSLPEVRLRRRERSRWRPRKARSSSPCCPTRESATCRRRSSKGSRTVATPNPDARRYALLPNPFPLWGGGTLREARVAFESWGKLSAAKDNAILLFTGLSPPAHAASSAADPSEGWWERMIGPGLAIDTNRFCVICINSLGSCFGSTGPASVDPQTGAAYRLAFPDLALEDIARSGYEAARSLGIEQPYAVIGPSLGGMVVLAYAALLPHGARRLISISGTAAASPFAIALRSIQREAVRGDPAWQNGNYAFAEPPRTGLRLARKLGTVTYRSAAEWRE